MNVFFTLTLFAILFFPNDQLDPPDRSSVTMRYIDQFAALAVKEMQRTGIPASITLAQGIHESQSGQSPLARNANNHFGIKCKSYWPGPVYLHKDDDTDKRGNLIESCFRAYNSAVASYLDHSEFLKHRKYYRDLFSLSPTDYEAWARGLKKAGYATDPNYADILIRIIRTYELDTYDHLNLHAEIKIGTVLAPLSITTLKQVESLTPPKQISGFYREKVR